MKIFSAQTVGLKTHIISVEVDIFRGFHAFSVVGLPDKAVEESRDRVSSAIKSAGFGAPKEEGQKKIVVSLAPADLKKEGPLFDLPIALAYLREAEELSFDPRGKLFLGELSLSGELQPLRGALFLAQIARAAGFHEIFLPAENAREAALIEGIAVYGARTIHDVIGHLMETAPTPAQHAKGVVRKPLAACAPTKLPTRGEEAETIADIRGQETAKRGLAIAAAGGHNIALYGPPGTGKTLLARALASLAPALSFKETLEVTGIHSVAGTLQDDVIVAPPFRAPHHTASHTAVIGGGTTPKPGEATLAHRGVLFLDEFPEFDRRVIEALRQPLEEGIVSISRVRGSEQFPARFTLVVSLNPCPCGYFGDEQKTCACTRTQLQNYWRKFSGPIADRIDMWIHVPRISYEELAADRPADERRAENEHYRALVRGARKRARKRNGGELNSAIAQRVLNVRAPLQDDVRKTLNKAAETLALSPRAYHRVIKLARTIADLHESEEIERAHILEALQYRPQEHSFF